MGVTPTFITTPISLFTEVTWTLLYDWNKNKLTSKNRLFYISVVLFISNGIQIQLVIAVLVHT